MMNGAGLLTFRCDHRVFTVEEQRKDATAFSKSRRPLSDNTSIGAGPVLISVRTNRNFEGRKA